MVGITNSMIGQAVVGGGGCDPYRSKTERDSSKGGVGGDL